MSSWTFNVPDFTVKADSRLILGGQPMLNIGLAGLGWWGKHMTHTLKESKKLNLVRAAEVKIEGHL